MLSRASDKLLISFIIPAYLCGDLSIYKGLNKKYKIKPFSLKLLLYIYIRYSLLDGKKTILYADVLKIQPGLRRDTYQQMVKELRMSGLVYLAGRNQGYTITDKGIECIKDYYRLVKEYSKLFEREFKVKEVGKAIKAESSHFYTQ